jgi:hypothetical protein
MNESEFFVYTIDNYIDVPVVYADFGASQKFENFYSQDIVYGCKKDDSEYIADKKTWNGYPNFLGVSTIDLSYDGSHLNSDFQNMYNSFNSHRTSHFKSTKNIIVSQTPLNPLKFKTSNPQIHPGELDIFVLSKRSNRKLLATSNTDETEIFIWNLNNIRKNKSYGESMADIPDKTLLLGHEWRVVNFKWVENNSNSMLVSAKHVSNGNRFKLFTFNVGICDHFQMSKSTKQVTIQAVCSIDFDYLIEDFCMYPMDKKKILVIGDKKQAMIELITGKEILEFKTQINEPKKEVTERSDSKDN